MILGGFDTIVWICTLGIANESQLFGICSMDTRLFSQQLSTRFIFNEVMDNVWITCFP